MHRVSWILAVVLIAGCQPQRLAAPADPATRRAIEWTGPTMPVAPALPGQQAGAPRFPMDGPMPELLHPVGEFAAAATDSMIMAQSAQTWPKYRCKSNGVFFTLGVDGEYIVRFISTTDPSFSAPEGIRAGDSYQHVKEVSGQEAIAERGWAYYVPLKSGWNAAFYQGSYGTEGELTPKSQVTFVFRRCGYGDPPIHR